MRSLRRALTKLPSNVRRHQAEPSGLDLMHNVA